VSTHAFSLPWSDDRRRYFVSRRVTHTVGLMFTALMTNRLPTAPSWLRASFGLVLVLVFLTVGGVQAQEGSGSVGRPAQNVVLIIADDMRHDSWWAMPALNRLAGGGVTFDRFYVTTPLCCPSRASILTGLYARHHGVLSNDPRQGSVERFDDRSTMATWLQSAGVRTGLIGRYLNGYQSPYVPPGWEFWFAMWQSGGEYGNYYRYRVTDNGRQRYFGSSSREYSTTVLGQQAVKFISQEPSRPFLLMLTPRTPHGPGTPDRETRGSSKSASYHCCRPTTRKMSMTNQAGFGGRIDSPARTMRL
jgi:arylsulfatase A-like enzyme